MAGTQQCKTKTWPAVELYLGVGVAHAGHFLERVGGALAARVAGEQPAGKAGAVRDVAGTPHGRRVRVGCVEVKVDAKTTVHGEGQASGHTAAAILLGEIHLRERRGSVPLVVEGGGGLARKAGGGGTVTCS